MNALLSVDHGCRWSVCVVLGGLGGLGWALYYLISATLSDFSSRKIWLWIPRADQFETLAR